VASGDFEPPLAQSGIRGGAATMAAPYWTETASAYARDAAGPVVGASGERVPASVARDDARDSLCVETLDLAQMQAHAGAWRALSERALEPNAFFDPGFALALARHRSGRARPRFAAVWRDARRRNLVGLFPLAATSRGLARIWLDEQTPLATPLVDRPCAHAAFRALLVHMQETERAAGLVFPQLTQNGSALRVLLAAARATGRTVETLSTFERAALLAGSGADALARRGASNHALRELCRRRRRLGEIGEIEFTLMTEPSAAQDAFEEFLALEASGWKGRRGALLRERNLASFARCATEGMARGGQCQIARLSLDGRPLAMGILFESGDRAYFWKIAFDERFRAYAPGIDLVHRLTGVLAERDDIALTDSCAIANHPMIDRFWPDRIGVCDIAVALDCARPRAFRAACAVERLRRELRERVKRLANRALRRKVS
jgi:CelD/BcsL family acetyltransferase involved in cellulose biosynthesis